MGETVVVRLQECVPALCQSIWRFGQISCRKPDKMVQETTSTQPGRCLGRLCGTNSVLCVKKTVPHYLADPGVLSVKRQNPHLSRHGFDVPGLRDAAQAQGPRQPVISHLVWHISVRQSEAGAL